MMMTSFIVFFIAGVRVAAKDRTELRVAKERTEHRKNMAMQLENPWYDNKDHAFRDCFLMSAKKGLTDDQCTKMEVWFSKNQNDKKKSNTKYWKAGNRKVVMPRTCPRIMLGRGLNRIAPKY